MSSSFHGILDWGLPAGISTLHRHNTVCLVLQEGCQDVWCIENRGKVQWSGSIVRRLGQGCTALVCEGTHKVHGAGCHCIVHKVLNTLAEAEPDSCAEEQHGGVRQAVAGQEEDAALHEAAPLLHGGDVAPEEQVPLLREAFNRVLTCETEIRRDDPTEHERGLYLLEASCGLPERAEILNMGDMRIVLEPLHMGPGEGAHAAGLSIAAIVRRAVSTVHAGAAGRVVRRKRLHKAREVPGGRGMVQQKGWSRLAHHLPHVVCCQAGSAQHSKSCIRATLIVDGAKSCVERKESCLGYNVKLQVPEGVWVHLQCDLVCDIAIQGIKLC
mmetsp:Transcript_16453/g.45860  ORF Transcript_16453/g.45860 Transcript_16453/m.45860 type:complete len:327 (+) Transcript_16453:257-1237(+)